MDIELSLRDNRKHIARYDPRTDMIVIYLPSVHRVAMFTYLHRWFLGKRWDINRGRCFRVFVYEFVKTVEHEILHHYFCRELGGDIRGRLSIQTQERLLSILQSEYFWGCAHGLQAYQGDVG